MLPTARVFRNAGTDDLIRCRTLTLTVPARFRSSIVVALVGMAVVSLTMQGSFAQTSDTRWINISGGTFHNAANWEDGVPDPDINAIFDINSFYDVELESSHTVRSFQQSDGEIVWFGGNTLTMNNGSNLHAGILSLSGMGTQFNVLGDFKIGESGDATLNLNAGTTFSNQQGVIGGQAGFTGTANINGPGARWNTNGLQIGEFGSGNLNIFNGGHVESASAFIADQTGSTGSVTVNGTGSSWTVDRPAGGLVVGERGNGQLNVEAGGIVLNTGSSFFGARTGASGIVNVNGAGSRLDQGTLFVGSLGSGTLNITDGGQSTSIGGVIGVEAESTGTINISDSGSSFSVTDAFTVGGSGLGETNVTNSGVLNSFLSIVGGQSGSQGTVTVSGTGSTWNVDNELWLGNSGDATLRINGGGIVNATEGTTFLGKETGSTGLLEIEGAGSVLNTGSLVAGEFGFAEINVANGGGLRSSSSLVGLNNGSQGTVTVSGVNSNWIVEQGLSIGVSGIGQLEIGDGGSVSTGQMNLGTNSIGIVNVTGPESRLSTTQINVGNGGSGTLSVTGGGQSISNSVLVANRDSGSTGTINISDSGSHVRIFDILTLGMSGVGELNITNGGELRSSFSIVGSNSDSQGTVDVSGTGSTWNVDNELWLGNSGDATLRINGGGVVNAIQAATYLGKEAFSTGLLEIEGAGSAFNADTRNLFIGDFGAATLSVSAGGQLDASNVFLGNNSGSSGLATIVGQDTAMNVGSFFQVGFSGTGELNLLQGAQLTTNGGVGIGNNSGSVGTMKVEGLGTQWNGTGLVEIGNFGTGELRIENGGSVDINQGIFVGKSGSGNLVVDGPETTLTAFNITVNPLSSISVTNGATVSSTTGINSIGSSGSFGNSEFAAAIVSGQDSSWVVSNLSIGSAGNGRLRIEDGGSVVGGGSIGRFANGDVTITGAGSSWDLGGNTANIGWGNGGEGSLLIANGGRMESRTGSLGDAIGGIGSVIVSGANSTWETSQQLAIGTAGTGSLEINNGGYVVNRSSTLGGTDNGNADVLVTGNNSLWELESNLSVGTFGNSLLEINHGGTVRVGMGGFEGLTAVGEQGAISLNGGRLEFGVMDIESFARISGTSGSLAGGIEFDGYNHISTLSGPSIQNLDLSEVRAANSGVIYGSGSTTLGIQNRSDGELRTRLGEWALFTGVGNTNAGEINNFGGLIEFESDFTNEAGGFVGGRGQFIVGGNIVNEGVMAFSVGTTDILGDVDNIGGGQIITSGFASTTFFDDVIHNGSEIRTAQGSATVFLGEFSGAGDFTGTGDVFFEGDLRPGNSPGSVNFEGNVFLGTGAETLIELAGLGLGEFDQLSIAGNLYLDGDLSVSLLDGFDLGANQEFLIADVGGDLFGQFDGLGEGDLLGMFGNQSLFISYQRGDGNDIALFTSVPEPTSGFITLLAVFGILFRRSRLNKAA